MDTYVILRRGGFESPQHLDEAAERSTEVGDQMGEDKVRWIRSYVTEESDGTVGTVCVYQAESPEAIREHSNAANLPADEIVKVADTVIMREDPPPAAA